MAYICETKINDLQMQLRLEIQRIEMDSGLIRKGAMQQFGLSDESELSSNHRADHYIGTRRAEEIGKILSANNFKATELRLGVNPRNLPPMQCLQELWDQFSPFHPSVSIPLLLLRPDLASFH